MVEKYKFEIYKEGNSWHIDAITDGKKFKKWYTAKTKKACRAKIDAFVN